MRSTLSSKGGLSDTAGFGFLRLGQESEKTDHETSAYVLETDNSQ